MKKNKQDSVFYKKISYLCFMTTQKLIIYLMYLADAHPKAVLRLQLLAVYLSGMAFLLIFAKIAKWIAGWMF
jgi:hypothetical protein